MSRWSGKSPQSAVLDMLLLSHDAPDRDTKLSCLCQAIENGAPRLWWYRVLKSYCADYKDGDIIGYDEPLTDIGLQGFDGAHRKFFKKADTKYFGRAPMRGEDVARLSARASL